MRVGVALALIVMLAVGIGMKVTRMESENAFTGEYDYSPLRTLTLTSSRDVADLVAPLRQWAGSNGYRFLVDSPTGERGSIQFQIWNNKIVVEGDNRLGNGGVVLSGLEFGIYWNGDVADKQLLDNAAEQLRTILAPFGPVEVVSAPPGTPPRKESTNLKSVAEGFGLVSP